MLEEAHGEDEDEADKEGDETGGEEVGPVSARGAGGDGVGLVGGGVEPLGRGRLQPDLAIRSRTHPTGWSQLICGVIENTN